MRPKQTNKQTNNKKQPFEQSTWHFFMKERKMCVQAHDSAYCIQRCMLNTRKMEKLENVRSGPRVRWTWTPRGHVARGSRGRTRPNLPAGRLGHGARDRRLRDHAEGRGREARLRPEPEQSPPRLGGSVSVTRLWARWGLSGRRAAARPRAQLRPQGTRRSGQVTRPRASVS